MRTVLFYRNFACFTGGHLKVWDYFEHVRHSPNYTPQIYFSETALWDATNPWLEMRNSVLPAWDSETADVVFMEGTDWLDVNWQAIDKSKPIVNLIQHIRHANPENVRYPFLANKAIRICVSPEVAWYLQETKRVNGPIYTIPLGLELPLLPAPRPRYEREDAVLIAGLKNPALAREVAVSLDRLGIKNELLTEQLPRPMFLDKLNRSKIAVLLPMAEGEGFFMPALEGMALETLVVCPDCVGNRSFCLDGVNCFRPVCDAEQIAQAALRATALSAADVESFRLAGLKTVAEHDLMRERQEFLEIMDNLEQIW